MTARTTLSLGLALAAVLAVGTSMFVPARIRAAGAADPRGTAKGPESPFACSPSALSPAERKQHFEDYGPKLRARLKQIRELPDGYEFAFGTDRDTYQTLAAWMFQERLCCPFFDLDLRIDREGGSTWLRLTGRAGVKEFLRAEFEPWFRMGS
jgi:hypothetical protein